MAHSHIRGYHFYRENRRERTLFASDFARSVTISNSVYFQTNLRQRINGPIGEVA